MEKWLQDAVDAIKKSTPESRIYIGCDSVRYKRKQDRKNPKTRGNWYARYSVVVVLHNNNGIHMRGCSLFHNTFSERDYGDKDNLRARMLREAQVAIDVALAIREEIGPDRMIDLHLDINPAEEHKSSVAVNEALGWAKGMGFNAYAKPDAWAATHAADHVARRG